MLINPLTIPLQQQQQQVGIPPIGMSPGDIRKGNPGLLCQQGVDVRKQYLKNLNLLSVLT